MEFSLILATLNRSQEIRECLKSLETQTFQDFEVIVIDQSLDNDTKIIVGDFSNINIKYFKVNFKGLSKARNFGLKHVVGKYCCLLDDDAIYSENYLLEAARMLDGKEKRVLSGVILSIEDHITPFVKYKNSHTDKLSESDIMNYCPSAALIFPYKAFKECGGFNEKLGVGNEFASGEETDFLLRLFDENYEIYFCKDMVVYHPIKAVTSLDFVYKHYLGKGAVFKIDFCERRKIRLLSLLFKNTIGMWIKSYILDRENKNIYLTRQKGFIEGIISYK